MVQFIHRSESGLIKDFLETRHEANVKFMNNVRERIETARNASLQAGNRLLTILKPTTAAPNNEVEEISLSSYKQEPEEVSVNVETTTASASSDTSSSVTDSSITTTTKEPRTAINAKDRCPPGSQRDGSGACQPTFG
ncbi:hypothetical protein O3M35_006071 [Rhynocoris fuscipes]|uniref:Uncharacterized protein n=1 Tax=Rhynocoris fuscipes TaxID=488301 RepID=A0AAW1DH89_9HEMI